MGDVPNLTELIKGCRRSAVHLETRDGYAVNDPAYQAWRNRPPFQTADWYRPWVDLMTATIKRGVEVRRARIISEPVSDYIRFEYHVTADVNIAGGEDVRWLPRPLATDIALPGNDFWLFDDQVALVHYFSGDGDKTGADVFHGGPVVALCDAAFQAVWDRAVPHVDYRPT